VKTPIAILFATMTVALVSHGADKPCSPTTLLGSQQRSKLKHRKPMTTVPTKTTVADVIAWAVPSTLSDPTVKRSPQPIDPRERKLYTIRGDVWVAKTEDNDCDYHVEMSAAGGSKDDPRIIVEIPQERAAVRAALNKALNDSGQGDLENHQELELKKSVPITVTGWGFIDGYHWSKKQPKIGNHHGSAKVATLWELHPVFDLTAK
jgi:hypothetical protein